MKKLKLFRKKVKFKDCLFYFFLAVFFLIVLSVVLLPVMRVVAVSFNDEVDVIRNCQPFFWPRQFTLDNYKLIFSKDFFFTELLITLLRTVIGTVSGLLANSLVAYILSRKRFLFRKFLSVFLVISMFLEAGLIPTYVLYKNIYMTGTFWVYIIPNIINVTYVMIIKTYMKNLPQSLEDAAKIDGAGDFTVFTRIISPLCKPVYAAITLFIALFHWNSWYDNLIFNGLNFEYHTMQYRILKMLDYLTSPKPMYSVAPREGQVLTLSTFYAEVVISILPFLIIYPFLQSFFTAGVDITGIKE